MNALDEKILDLRLARLGYEPRLRRRFVHETAGRFNTIVPCGRPDCDLCRPRRRPRFLYR